MSFALAMAMESIAIAAAAVGVCVLLKYSPGLIGWYLPYCCVILILLWCAFSYLMR